MTIKPGGFTEVGLSTADLDGWVDVLTSVGGYKEVWRGETPASTRPLWGLAPESSVQECLLGRPGFGTGFIRLYRFKAPEQVEIRRDMMPWDSGGIYDLDIRVASVPAFVDRLESRGWQSFAPPADWTFGQVQVREWLVRGPESVTLALIERLAPRMEDIDALDGFSHIFNSTQIVSDMQRSADFYYKLGFIDVVHLEGPLPGRGGELLGLSPAEAPTTPVDLLIVHPEGVMDGSVELITIANRKSRNAGPRALPHNLGLNLLRFPVSNLQAYMTQLEQLGLLPADTQAVSTRIEPFGETQIFALRTPDGAWLEFYQEFS